MRPQRVVAVALVASLAGSGGFVAAYAAGASTQLLGAALALALLGFGTALVVWGRRLAPRDLVTQLRQDPSGGPRKAAAAEARAGARQAGRRRLLGGLLAAALGALGLALLTPLRSLGPRPGRMPATTAWRRGVRLVDTSGAPVRLGDLQPGATLAVFPAGETPRAGAGLADDQAVLIHLMTEPAEVGGAISRHVAYSRVCTHAGCPVGMYQERAHVLLCPCHQATFDAVDGARPLFGPAPRPLPRLPLAVDDAGFLVADGGFSAPVGPGRWRLG